MLLQKKMSNLLKSSAMKSDNSWTTSFSSQVGTGSNWHVLFSADPIIFFTSSRVTAVHWESVGVTLSGTSYNGVVAVKAWSESTLSWNTWRTRQQSCYQSPRLLLYPVLCVMYATASVSCHCLPRSWWTRNCYVWLHKMHAWPSACPPKLVCPRTSV